MKVLVGGDSGLDDGLYLLCTEMCVDGRYFQGGSVVSRWGIRGEVFLGGAKRGGPGRTVRIPGKCGMRNAECGGCTAKKRRSFGRKRAC